jgi:flagellar L-ring protein precursor FlgH
MKTLKINSPVKFAAALMLATALTGCNTLSRLSEVNRGPQMSEISNPTAAEDYRPVSMPMPAPEPQSANPNSLWRPGAKAFFKDERAKNVGDIVTVTVSIDDSASLANNTTRAREDSEDVGVDNLFGLGSKFYKNHLSGHVVQGSELTLDTESDNEGDGTIDRSESISLTFAAVITQVLPNGLLAFMGRQEVKVNAELRELQVTGLVRPEDIESDNTISHDKIAEMRVAYGGRGTLSDLQQPRWGYQLIDILFPF